jgi:hypothetical protein
MEMNWHMNTQMNDMAILQKHKHKHAKQNMKQNSCCDEHTVEEYVGNISHIESV